MFKPSALLKDLRKIDKTDSTKQKVGSGRPRTVRTEQNIGCVAELTRSQENNPGSSKSLREFENLIGISRSPVRRIAENDLWLQVFRRNNAHLLSDSDRDKVLQNVVEALQRSLRRTVRFCDERITWRTHRTVH